MKFGLSCLRRGNHPHRWKSRRAGKTGPALPCPDRDFRKAFRSERAVNDALRLGIELRKVGSTSQRSADL